MFTARRRASYFAVIPRCAQRTVLEPATPLRDERMIIEHTHVHLPDDRSPHVRHSEQVSSGVSSSFVHSLGALAHGPCILSAGPGIGIGLRCVFAFYDGLLLSVEVKAIGRAARDAYDSHGHPRSGRGGRRAHPQPPRLPLSSVRLDVPESAAGTRPDGQEWPGPATHFDSTSHAARGYSEDDPGTPAYVQDLDVWWPNLPEDARLPLEAGWPELGAAMTTTVLALDNLDQLDEQVVRLR